MTLEFSEMALAGNNWDLDAALKNFEELRVSMRYIWVLWNLPRLILRYADHRAKGNCLPTHFCLRFEGLVSQWQPRTCTTYGELGLSYNRWHSCAKYRMNEPRATSIENEIVGDRWCRLEIVLSPRDARLQLRHGSVNIQQFKCKNRGTVFGDANLVRLRYEGIGRCVIHFVSAPCFSFYSLRGTLGGRCTAQILFRIDDSVSKIQPCISISSTDKACSIFSHLRLYVCVNDQKWDHAHLIGGKVSE